MKLSLLKRTRQPLLSSNSPRLHLPGIIPPLRSPRSVGGEPPVGHAVSDDVEGQHSRDLGWATNLLGMLLVIMLKASIVEILDGQPTCWACNLRSATTSSPPATGRSTPAPPFPPRVPPPQVVGCYRPPLIYK